MTPALLADAIAQVRAEVHNQARTQFNFSYFPNSGITKPGVLGCSSAQIQLAIQIVTSLLECGYNPDHPNSPLTTEGWACLAAGLLSAMGKGFIRTDVHTLLTRPPIAQCPE
jgi:hypothetical protein